MAQLTESSRSKAEEILRVLTESLDFCEISVREESRTMIVFRISFQDKSFDFRFTEEGISNPVFVRITINKALEIFT